MCSRHRSILIVTALTLACAACTIPGVDFTGLGDDVDELDAATDAPPGSPRLVVSATTVVVGEAAEASFDVSLSHPPSAPVIVTVEPSDEAVLGSRPQLLVFEAQNWQTAQPVTVSGKPDADPFDDTGTVTLTSVAAGNAVVDVTVDDDDALRIVTTPVSAVEVDEAATTTMSVRLSAMPAGDVVVEVTSLDPSIAAVAPGTLTFGVDDWGTEQDVLVTGVQDDDTDGETTTLRLASPGSPELETAMRSVAVIDDDVLRIVPSLTNLGTVTEGGATSFEVYLSHPIAADLDVSVTSSDASALAVTPASLHFTSTTWMTPQTIMVTAAQDVDDVDESATINLATTAEGVIPRTVAAAVTDDDEQELIVAPAGVSVDELATTPFTVALRYQPAAAVTVSVTSLATSVATATPPTLTFSPSDYDDPQTVIVRGTDDQDAAQGTTTVHLESLAPALAEDVPVTVIDDDDLTIATDVASVTLSEVGTASVQVRLTAAPNGSLVVIPLSDDATAATVSPPMLTFTAANWNAYQTVTVTGVHDVDNATDSVAVSLTSTAAPTVTVAATVSDVDVQAILATPPSALTVTEGMTGTVAVRLMFQPSSNVVVSATSSTTTSATVSPSSLTFTPANYATAQTLTVTGVQDDDASAASATVTLSAPSITPSVPIAVTITDDDELAIELDRTSLSVLEGGTGIVRARLTARPPGNVAVAVASSDAGAATASPASLTFTPVNWGSYQTINVAGVIDADASSETVTLTCSSASLPAVTASVNVTDTDVVGIVATPATVMPLEGGTATFQVTLSQAPSTSVTVTVVSDDVGEATVSPSSLAFTTQNWNSPQTVTLTGVQDNDLASESVDIDLSGTNLDGATVTAAITDDDTQRIVVSSSSLSVAENGSGTVNVRLEYQPAASVVVTASSANAAVATASPSTLTFTPANYATNQVLTIAGTDDPDAAIGTTTVSLSTPNVTTVSVGVTVSDDDPLAIETSVGSLAIGEAGTGTFGVRLTAQPSGNVTVNVASSDAGAGTVAPASLTFTTTTWNTYQTVTVTGVDDVDAAGESILVTCSGSGVITRTVGVAITDDDPLIIVASTTSVTLTETGTATFQVRLGAQPPATTSVTVTSADAGAATVAPASLSFTTSNWSTNQTVTVTGVDDVDMAAESVAISLAAAGLTTVVVTASVTDPDPQQVVASPSTLTVGEGSTGTVTVRLQYQPAANTTVTVSLDSSIATASASTLTFTPANYATTQNLVITGVQDGDGINDTTTLSLTSSGATSASVALTINDDEDTDIEASVTSLSVNEGATATFQVRLQSQPPASLTVTCSSSDTTSATLSPSSLTFTTSNYGTYQTVTVTGVQDSDTANDVPLVTCSASGWGPDTVSITAYDNDTLTTDVTALAVMEAGTATLGIRLTAQPSSSVVVNVASSDTGTATVSPSSRTFTTTNWNTYQMVTVTGVSDADGTNDGATLTLSATGYSNRTVSVTAHDRNTITASSGAFAVGEGDTYALSVRLLQAPPASVTVTVAADVAGVVSLSPSILTFTTSNWSTNQTVTVTGTADADTTNDTTPIAITASGFATYYSNANVLEYRTLMIDPWTDNGGTGTVTSTPTGINCGVGGTGTCTRQVLDGSSVMLVATAGANSGFWSWENCAPWDWHECSLTVTAPVTVRVHFPRLVLLTVTKSGTGAGTVSDQWNALNCGPQCTWLYHWPATVAITATPSAGSVFSHWTGACNGQGATCNLNFSAATSTTAVFNAQ